MAIEIDVKMTDKTREEIRELVRETVRETLERYPFQLPLGTVTYSWQAAYSPLPTPGFDALLAGPLSYWSK